MKLLRNQKGSLALEHVLFIAAIVVASAAVVAFYNNIGGYLGEVSGQVTAADGGTLTLQ